MPDQNNPTDTSAPATAQWPLERPAHNNPKAAIVIASNGVSWNCPPRPYRGDGNGNSHCNSASLFSVHGVTSVDTHSMY